MESLNTKIVRSLETFHGEAAHDQSFLTTNLKSIAETALSSIEQELHLKDPLYSGLSPAASVVATATAETEVIFAYDLADLVKQEFFTLALSGGVSDFEKSDQVGRDMVGNTVRIGDMVAVPRSSMEGYSSLDAVFVSSINDRGIATSYFDSDGQMLGGSLYPGESVRLSESVLARRVQDEGG